MVYSTTEAKEIKKGRVLMSKTAPLPSAECFCFDGDLKPSFAAIKLPSMDASAEIECMKYGNQNKMQCEYDPSLSPSYVSLDDAPGF